VRSSAEMGSEPDADGGREYYSTRSKGKVPPKKILDPPRGVGSKTNDWFSIRTRARKVISQDAEITRELTVCQSCA